MRYESKKKPRICPACGSNKIATYLYGMPAFSEIEKDLNEGKLVLGGCIISDDDPEWKCISCNIDIYKITASN